ncbi:Rossmann fold nucleotide-binding protein [Candidatus Omnitrophus magneticus]|uniref:AMP nucleosidase n=1 Tax=Candidatus Omnitrophus magneticus TaxID=1609969 RepID=A0A0F0CPZ1_9BACT|nr:Rossmann fold nucleotide-binding protein [Candidatus Omnitrophus magneticus]
MKKNKTRINTNKPIKAYHNSDFLNSPNARNIRILAEMIEPETRLKKHNALNSVVFFGSAVIKSKKESLKEILELKQKITKNAVKNNNLKSLKNKLEQAEHKLRMSKYYEDAFKLSYKLSMWFQKLEKQRKHFLICSGGGPGIMEAANKGAEKAKTLSIGLNISLPREQHHNPYQTKDLMFEFHYFFIRKFWFSYLAMALVIFPGGFGTMDELFELLTLIQTKKNK